MGTGVSSTAQSYGGTVRGSNELADGAREELAAADLGHFSVESSGLGATAADAASSMSEPKSMPAGPFSLHSRMFCLSQKAYGIW